MKDKTIEESIAAAKDISEVIDIPTPLDGEQTNLEKLIGKTIVILDYRVTPSKLDKAKEGDVYASVQAIDVQNKERIWFNTSSEYVIERLDEIKSFLPISCVVEQGHSKKSGMDYFNLIPAVTRDQVLINNWERRIDREGLTS